MASAGRVEVLHWRCVPAQVKDRNCLAEAPWGLQVGRMAGETTMAFSRMRPVNAKLWQRSTQTFLVVRGGRRPGVVRGCTILLWSRIRVTFKGRDV